MIAAAVQATGWLGQRPSGAPSIPRRVGMAQGCAAAQRMAQGRGMREQRAGGRRRKKGEGKKKREKEKERMGKRGKRRKRKGDVGGIRGGIRGVGRELSVASTRSDAHEK